MMWFFAVLIVLVLGAVVVVASGEGAPLTEEYRDSHDVQVPLDRPLTGADLRDLRFNTAIRGYRADEVDALLDRLAAQLDARPDDADVPGAARPDAPWPAPPASPGEGSDSGTMGE